MGPIKDPIISLSAWLANKVPSDWTQFQNANGPNLQSVSLVMCGLIHSEVPNSKDMRLAKNRVEMDKVIRFPHRISKSPPPANTTPTAIARTTKEFITAKRDSMSYL